MNSNYKTAFDLKGKRAIVTGATGILGRELCIGLAQLGADVAVFDLDAVSCQQFSLQLSESYRVRTFGFACDVSEPEAVRENVTKVAQEWGGIDILFNNAATKTASLESFLKPFEEYSLETWRQVESINLDGMFLMAQAVGTVMKRSGRGGSILQTASIYGVVAPDPRIYEGSFYNGQPISSPAVYSATKGGVVSLTRYLAAYWGRDGIRVNTLTPGGIESGQNEIFHKKYSERVPLGRMAEVSEIVPAALFLASDGAKYITGQNIVVDGGLTAW